MMVRKKKIILHTSNYRTKNDPKFQYKCYVRLENYDFSKYCIDPLKKDENKDDCLRGLNEVESKNTKSLEMNELRNNLKKVRNEQKLPNIKQPHVITAKPLSTDMSKEIHDETSSFVERKVLRARKQVNYKEKKSIGTPDVRESKIIDPIEKKHIPIYKKIDEDLPKSRKRKGDMYDFIPESDDDKDSDVSFRINLPAKRKRVNHHVNFQDKVPDKKLREVKLDKNMKNVTYRDKINGLLNKFAGKITKNKNDHNEASQTNARSKRNPVRKDQIDISNEPVQESVFNSTMLPETRKVILLDESIIVKGCEGNNLTINLMGGEKVDKTANACIPPSDNSSFNSLQDSTSNLSSLNSFGNMSIRSFDGNIENLFGFDDELVEDNRKEASNRIKIIQNVEVNKSIPSKQYISTPKHFKPQRSWRFNSSSVNRNPHFISLKKNSLPSLNQEPVLDHTFDERIGEMNNSLLVPSKKKSPRQQCILNYIETSVEHSQNHNYSQSLYDIDELSPVKGNDADKENSLEKKKLSNENLRTKRNILGLINDVNVLNESPPRNDRDSSGLKNSSSSSNKNSKDQENFGFDTITGDKEEQSVKAQAKPFRIEFTYLKRKKMNNLPEKMNQPVRESEVRRLIEEDPGFDKVVDQDGLDCGNLGLFEDIEQSPKPIDNLKPRTKKHTDQKTQKNKAPQDKLSKEAKKWIKEFNVMCDEVENEHLEVE